MQYKLLTDQTDPARRRCARGDSCADLAPHPVSGDPVAAWPESPSPFCKKDTRHVQLTAGRLPERYVALRQMLGDKKQARGERVSGSRTPPLPLRVDVDAVIRDILLVACSWHQRLADARNLTPPPPGRRRDEVALTAAIRVLRPHFYSVLLLPPAPMVRYLTWRSSTAGKDGEARAELLASLPPSSPVRLNLTAGYVRTEIPLGGVWAGLEVLDLDYRARRLLQMTTPPPVELLGVPCRKCEKLTLIIPPEPEYKSACTACGDLLTQEEYEAWVKMYAAYMKRLMAEAEPEPDSYIDQQLTTFRYDLLTLGVTRNIWCSATRMPRTGEYHVRRTFISKTGTSKAGECSPPATMAYSTATRPRNSHASAPPPSASGSTAATCPSPASTSTVATCTGPPT